MFLNIQRMGSIPTRASTLPVLALVTFGDVFFLYVLKKAKKEACFSTS